MVREDIVIGLKNALERGQSLRSAVQTMLNSGYPFNEVQEASKNLDLGVIGAMHANEQTQVSETNPNTAENSNEQDKLKSKNKTKIIILSVILALILAGIGASLYFIFK